MKSLHPSLVAVLSVLLLLPGLIYINLRLMHPSDASSPIVDFLSIQSGGLVVRPISPESQGLQNGDIVTAIQGRGIDQYLQDLFSTQRTTGHQGRIQYTVLRDNQTLQVYSPMTVFSLSKVIKANWSIYIYLVYLELVSLFVFILRPRLPAAQLFFVASNLLLSSGLVFFLSLRVEDLLYRWLVILYLWGAVALYGFMLAALVHLSLIFPKTHPLLKRHPRWLLVIYLGVWLPILAYTAVRWSAIVSPAGHLALIVQGTTLMSAVYFPLLLISTVSSYRTGNTQEKRQLRWIMWSLMISLIPYLVFTVMPSLLGVRSQLATSLLGLLWCTVPTSFAIAVLHERLFDIDVIIRRTLIYSTLTVSLGAVYFFSILLLQEFFQVFTGQHQPPLATVLSTLMIAALFTPLRRRIQNDIDRRFYRRKYDAEKTLEVFNAKLREVVDLNTLIDLLNNVVDETIQPTHFSIWLKKPPRALENPFRTDTQVKEDLEKGGI